MIKKLLYIFILLPLFAFGQEEDPCYSINDYNLLTQKANPPITLDLLIGWNMVGYGCREAADSHSIFQSISDVIVIAKDNIGYAYLPEWGYNGIGDLLPNQGYLVKMSESVVSFQICTSPINYHQIQGCMDCEAVNFSQWATINDRSCVYDSDYYGTNEAEEVIGCQDVSACDYNELATGEGVCQYAIEGYDCDGNLIQLQVGDLAEGGIVFYIDETGQHGLVAAMEDLDSYYEWGCYGTGISGANEQSIGTGLQNTLEIVAGCSETPIASSEALAYGSEGYSDWYLPSRYELIEMYNTIGNGGSEGNTGGFSSSYYWSSSEYNSNYAWGVYFPNGSTVGNGKTGTNRVRVIRAF